MVKTDETKPLGRVGFWWSAKKSQKLSFDVFRELCAERDLEAVLLDLDADLEPQGPFDLIVHKLSDVAAKADGGDALAKRQVDAFERYLKRHPDVIVIDRMEGVRILMDRYRQYKLIDDTDLADVVFTPPFAELISTDIDENLAKLKRAAVQFPFVCKPLQAHGSTAAHQMCLIFCEEGLREIKPPCVAQSFINHNARLYKIFVIKDKYTVITRPSLKNFQPGDFSTVYFDSHDISKPYSQSELTELDDDDNSTPAEPRVEYLDRIVKVVRSKLDIALFGIDVIIEKGTDRYVIIDINLFPGYDGVDNFLEQLRDLIVEEIEQHRKRRQIGSKPAAKATNGTSTMGSNGISGPPPADSSHVHCDQFDSGIDTSDSCDEKKVKPVPVKNVKRQHSKNLAATTAANNVQQ